MTTPTGKVRGALNKVTETNVALLAEEMKAVNFDEKSLLQSISLITARACEEPQNTELILQLVRNNEKLKEAFVEKLRMPNVLSSDVEPKVAVSKTKLVCKVRMAGMISAATYNGMVKELLEGGNDLALECICALQPFKMITPAATMELLEQKVAELERITSSMRLKFMSEDFLQHNSAPSSPALSSSSTRSSSSSSSSGSGCGVKPSVACNMASMTQRIAQGCTLYLSNIDCEVTEWELSQVLRSFGDLSKVRLCGNPRQATQYAFVEFIDEKSAKTALSRDGKYLLGKTALRWSSSKSIIQDSLPADAVITTRGLGKPCTFGYFDDGTTPSNTPLRFSNFQQLRK